jgi:hypothetical protein
MKTLLFLAGVSISGLSVSSVARACDGMKDHQSAADTQAQNDRADKADGKSNGKAGGKASKASGKAQRSDNGATKS